MTHEATPEPKAEIEEVITEPPESKGFNLRRFMIADGTSEGGLSNVIISRTGSGKTSWATRMLHDSQYLEDTGYINKTVFISPKAESILGAKVVYEPHEIAKVLEQDDIVIFVPSPQDYLGETDEAINTVFAMKKDVPNIGDDIVSYHIFVDDASIFLSPQKPPSPAFKNLVIAGRGLNIKGTFILHRFGMLPRLMSGNIGDLIVMSVANTDKDIIPRLFGFEIGDLGDELTDYRWAYVDLLTNNPQPIRYEAITPVE